MKCEVRSVKCEVWSVKFQVRSAKSAVKSVECEDFALSLAEKIKRLSREGHGRDRVSLNYRSFMFGKLPPPACPGLCYIRIFIQQLPRYSYLFSILVNCCDHKLVSISMFYPFIICLVFRHIYFYNILQHPVCYVGQNLWSRFRF